MASSMHLIEELRGIVGSSHVLTDPDLRASYETDWTRRWTGRSACVVRPGDTAQVAQVMAACSSAGVAVVPQGGNTGLVGGSVPGPAAAEPVIVSLRRLDEVSDVRRASGQLTTGAGCTLEVAQRAVAGSGWEVGVDLAARASATIGGMIATNAGGIRVLRDGMMRRQVVGLEAVLASGAVISSMRGLLKDNTGYDLIGLMCGSEGTLGIVTRAVLQLVPERPQRVVALLGVTGLDEAVGILTTLRLRLPSLESAEFVSGRSMALAREYGLLPAPFGRDQGGYLLLECAAGHDPLEELWAAVGHHPDTVVGVDAVSRARLWAYRETLTESIASRGIPRKVDVTVPLEHLSQFEADLAALLRERLPAAELYLFGHIADGGLHVNVIDDAAPGDRSVDDAILGLAAGFGGSVSAEHGIGRSKTAAIGLSRSRVEIESMEAIKRALDPGYLLNPGVLLPSP